MKLSAGEAGQGWKVFLNGQDIGREAVFADTDAGEVLVMRRDKHGHVMYDPATEEALTALKTGEVVIKYDGDHKVATQEIASLATEIETLLDTCEDRLMSQAQSEERLQALADVYRAREIIRLVKFRLEHM